MFFRMNFYKIEFRNREEQKLGSYVEISDNIESLIEKYLDQEQIKKEEATTEHSSDCSEITYEYSDGSFNIMKIVIVQLNIKKLLDLFKKEIINIGPEPNVTQIEKICKFLDNKNKD